MSKKENIVLIGASGHSKVVMDIVEKQGIYSIVGLIDSFKPIGTKVLDYEIIGSEETLNQLMETYNFKSGIISIGNNWVREAMFDKIQSISPDFNFVKAIDPSSIIGKNCSVGPGTVIMPGVIVNSDSSIGSHCILNTSSSLDHDGIMGDFSSLAPRSTVGGGVEIGPCSTIGLGAGVLEGITIGANCFIGAKSLTNKNVEDNNMVYGVPARFIRKIIKRKEILKGIQRIQEEPEIRNNPYEIITTKKKWDEILSKMGDYDFYHTFDYHQLSKRDEESILMFFYNDGQNKIAIPFLKRAIENTTYYDLSSVYGYAGPICNTHYLNFDKARFKNVFNQFIERENIVSVFSRLNPFIRNQQDILEGIGEIVNIGPVVNIDLTPDLNAQRALFSKTTKRYLNKTRRLFTIEYCKNTEEILPFISLYYKTMERVGAEKRYYFNKEYFTRLFNSSDFNAEIVYARSIETDEIVCGALMVMTNGIVQYHLSGTKVEFLNNTPLRLLIDITRIKATKKGYEYFNLGGGLGGNEDSLFYFKSSFSKDIKEFKVWKHIANEKVYNTLCKEYWNNFKNDEASRDFDFFPLYRLDA
ncbi:acetyltransferase [Muriicola soli]|uniref:Acetyltransferase n=1 Tax=Muriicola soli TaxID=2507538 RepID=A0A411E8M5_9FLAO|nr:acetyltransferase [Muriicola soli]QBA63883.1 acetyltransferase [Muriicola soli]